MLQAVAEHCGLQRAECSPYFEDIFPFFLPFFFSAPNNKADQLLSLSLVLLWLSLPTESFLPSLLTLSFLLTSSHPCWCEFADERKGWESQRRRRLLLLSCHPREDVSCYRWTFKKKKQKQKKHIHSHVGNRKPRMENTGVDTVKIVKIINTHKDTAAETHLLFIHTFFFLHPAAFFSFLQTVWPLHSPITTSNHKCKSQGHVRRDDGQSKIKLVNCSYLCCNWEKWYK